MGSRFMQWEFSKPFRDQPTRDDFWWRPYSQSDKEYCLLNVLSVLVLYFLCDAIACSLTLQLGIFPIALQCFNCLLGTISPMHWHTGWLLPSMHNSGENVTTANTLTTTSCINVEVCSSTIIFFGRQWVSVSVQKRRPQLRHSQMSSTRILAHLKLLMLSPQRDRKHACPGFTFYQYGKCYPS